MSTLSEEILWNKYNLFVPKRNRVSKKVFHSLYKEYKNHPDEKDEILNKLKSLSKLKGRVDSSKNKSSNKSKKNKRKNVTRRRY